MEVMPPLVPACRPRFLAGEMASTKSLMGCSPQHVDSPCKRAVYTTDYIEIASAITCGPWWSNYGVVCQSARSNNLSEVFVREVKPHRRYQPSGHQKPEMRHSIYFSKGVRRECDCDLQAEVLQANTAHMSQTAVLFT